MTPAQHGLRIGALMTLAAVLLGWLVVRTDILFADGLRYIDQAQQLDRGALSAGLKNAVDHPAYPMSIVATHRALGGDGPVAWQTAAQVAAVFAAILLVIPLYLLAVEVFGERSAWLGVALFYATPVHGHVFADTLSESTFLLFWTWALWAAVKFLRHGTFGWLPLTITFSGLAYLSRPEGLLLPAALVATLGVMPFLRSTRLYWPRWWAAVGFLVLGPALLVGPYVFMKGGLATKPAVGRILGLAPKSAPDAVERNRPLERELTTPEAYASASKAVFEAVRDSVSIPLLPLAALGILRTWPWGLKARLWLFLGIIGIAATFALLRLHATGGYCSPRHALVLSELLILGAASALDRGLRTIKIPGRYLGLGDAKFTAGPAIWIVLLSGYAAWAAPAIKEPINAGFGGYRKAGDYLAKNVPQDAKVVDVTGWSLYYAQRSGYTFANLIEAPGDPNVRWVVARESHLKGPWGYCQKLRQLVAGLAPVETYAEQQGNYWVRVYVFDRKAGLVTAADRKGDRR
jgi:hypothetical protein